MNYIIVNGYRLEVSRDLSTDFCGVSLDKETKIFWQICADDNALQRWPHEYGPARQAFHSRFVIITGTGQSSSLDALSCKNGECAMSLNEANQLTDAHLLSAAKYISVGHLAASATVAPIIRDTDLDAAFMQKLVDR